MTPPASHCCRALQRQIASPRDSVWISDSVLAATFGRYCLVSKTWHRKASNVPGPLESRRRLGKRQMGDINGLQCASSPPNWAFPVPLNLSQWRWEPPQSHSDLERLHPRRASTDAVAFSVTIPRWLGEWAARVEDEDQIPLSDLAPPPVAKSPPFRTLLDDFLGSIANAPEDIFITDATYLCHKLQQSIFLGEMSPEDLMSISADLWSALDSRLDNSSDDSQLYFSLYSAIVTGVATSKVFRPSLLPPPFWNALLLRMSKLPVDDALYVLFGKVMDATHHIRSGIVKGVASVLARFFFAWTINSRARTELEQARASLTSVDAALSAHARHIGAISKAVRPLLRTLDPGSHGRLFDVANELVLEQIQFVLEQDWVSATRQCELRYNWLSVLAQMPHVRQKSLFKAAERLCSDPVGTEPLRSTELCSLIISQWASRGYLKSAGKVRQKYKNSCSGHEDKALASLVLAIFQEETCLDVSRKGLYSSLWQLLAKLDRSDDMIESLRALSHTCRVPRDLLGALSAATQDHHVVLHLHTLYKRHLQRFEGADWDPSLFERHAENIVLDPSLPAGTIWYALDIDQLEKRVDNLALRRSRHQGTYGAQRVAIIKKVAPLLMDAPHVQGRTAFRHASRYVRFLEEVTGVLPASYIYSLYRVVTRDLAEGQPGRTTRLLWLLHVIERNYGKQLSHECRHALKRWRYRLKQLWIMRGGGQNGDTKEQ
ncbi:hypothetical protein B0H67DRAFT_477244 [Lasiosphaeris hirsuta]|uniref:Uncharacterized protein n=1 Tax=Lasiosphaeris hirsuta TaxID=260670 RepID=A0AA40BCI0_9PEZI|nr:hypothetical protein B0H67DRAFT_477244 [Lasiosphaeris hirsuta]